MVCFYKTSETVFGSVSLAYSFLGDTELCGPARFEYRKNSLFLRLPRNRGICFGKNKLKLKKMVYIFHGAAIRGKVLSLGVR